MSAPTTILLAAHGARTGSASNEMIEALARRLRPRTDHGVQPAFNLGEPRFPDAIPPAGDVIVVPVMTGHGYFVDERLLEELAKSPHYDATRVRITPPVGVVPAIVDEMVANAIDAARGLARAPTILVVAHGTTRDAISRKGGEGIVARIVERVPDADARAVFLDDAPLLEEVAPTLPRDVPILIVPWLWGGGGHFQDDIRERLGDAFARATVLPPMGELTSLDDAVLGLLGQALLPVSTAAGGAVVVEQRTAGTAAETQAGMPVQQHKTAETP